MTVDFYARVFDVVGVEVERVAITELRDETFISTVTLRATGQTHDLDARPSDALNLAARQDAPMFVSTEVMQKVGFSGVEPATWLEEDAAKEGRPIEAGLGWRSGLELAPDIFN